jgi:hypothetical protein
MLGKQHAAGNHVHALNRCIMCPNLECVHAGNKIPRVRFNTLCHDGSSQVTTAAPATTTQSCISYTKRKSSP